MKKNIGIVFLTIFTIFTVFAYAGGSPEFVKFPEAYKDSFNLYHTQNRANNKQVADLYANKIAIDSINKGELADGSIVIMEVYKPELNAAGTPITGANGVFKKSQLAAIAVMEKRSHWADNYSADQRAGNWGFALYSTDGQPKDNDLNCASCHAALVSDDYLFSANKLGGK